MVRRHVSGGDAWVADVAAAWAQRLAARPGLRMCLATGRTPLPVYEWMSASPGAFAGSAILLLDEFGGLAPDEPASCDRVLREHLIDHVRPVTYRGIDAATDDLTDECRAIDRWIDDGGLDLAVVGLGVNGHIGMNEPGSPADGRTARVELAASTVAGAAASFGGRAVPTWGVTVGLGDLLAAREVWVLVTGQAKAAIVAQCLDGPPSTDVPASLLQGHADCTWWLDEDAAG